MKKRIMALILCFAMALSVLTGCNSSKTAYTSSAEGSASVEAPAGEVPQEAYDDVVRYLTDGEISADTVLMTINGADISAEYYFYWLGYYFSQMSAYYSYYGQAMDLTAADESGNTMAQSLQKMADQAVTTYAAMTLEAKGSGVDLTEEEKQQVEEYAAAQDPNYLIFNSATVNAIKQANCDYYYYSAFGEKLFGENGEYAITDEDVQAYVEEQGIFNCRYILCKVDEDADEETEKAAKDTCQEYYDELSKLSGEKLLARFQELQGNNPDGNTDEFSFDASSSLTEGFRETLQTMKIGDVAMSDKTGYGYFVILRLEPDMDAQTEACRENAYAEKLSELTADYKAENTPSYDKVDAAAVLAKLQELQDTIVAVESAKSEAAAEAESSAEPADASASAQ